MKFLSWKCHSLAVALATTAAVALAAPALAEKPDGGGGPRARQGGGLFDTLFGGSIRYRPVYEPDDAYQQQGAQRAPRAVVKVDAPSYYDYKADPLVRVDFAALKTLPTPEKADFQP